MIILETLSEIVDFRAAHFRSVAFVPTMGNLHDGHLKLVTEAQKLSPTVLVSIFVNPTQFNDPADFEKYPRTLDADLEKLRLAGVTAVFLPTRELLYPDHFRFQISENEFSRELCGAHRPGHFTGVLTVVMKLVQLSGARWMMMGLKDFQQFQLVRDLCETFFVDISVLGVETVREKDGLAMSSRNSRLDEKSRARAPFLFSTISDSQLSDADCRSSLESAGFRVDYVETRNGRRFAAAFLADVRLIDNVMLTKPKSLEMSL